jgi:hypothetical protein
VEVPIRILAYPSCTRSDEKERVPANWKPVKGVEQSVELKHEEGKVSKYYKGVI